MDALVEKALAKWPNVPHCYSWLALDARGSWRMRDDNAQKHNRPGDRITQAALIGFINRNYTHDEQGRWYFQNGPQRVYVNLEAAPYIARTEPQYGFFLQTGEQFHTVEAAWLSDQGRLWLQGDGKIALLDDRDLAQCMSFFFLADQPVSDEQLMEWMADPDIAEKLRLEWKGYSIPIGYIDETEIAPRFHFIRQPHA